MTTGNSIQNFVDVVKQGMLKKFKDGKPKKVVIGNQNYFNVELDFTARFADRLAAFSQKISRRFRRFLD